MLLFALAIPYPIGIEVFTTTDGPVHVLLFGPYAIVVAVAWALEAVLRSRPGGGTAAGSPGAGRAADERRNERAVRGRSTALVPSFP